MRSRLGFSAGVALAMVIASAGAWAQTAPEGAPTAPPAQPPPAQPPAPTTPAPTAQPGPVPSPPPPPTAQPGPTPAPTPPPTAQPPAPPTAQPPAPPPAPTAPIAQPAPTTQPPIPPALPITQTKSFAQPAPTVPPPAPPPAAPTPPPPAPAPTPMPAPTTPPPAPFPSDLQAGGLAPPAPSTPPPVTTPPPTKTEKDLDKAKEEDSKRGLEWVWINAEGGFSHVDLKTFVGNDDFTFGFVDTQATGGMVGAGLGVRLVFITLGARGRIGFYDPWQMFTVGGELGFHIPIGRVDISFALGGGYAALGSVDALAAGAKDAISIQGGYGRVSGGLDVYITPIFSVGVMASGDFLGMVRPGLDPTQITNIKNDPSITEAQRQAADGLGFEGTSYGIAAGVTGVLGLHF